jgi:hypothetical protein
MKNQTHKSTVIYKDRNTEITKYENSKYTEEEFGI